jgi:hypothetical protein
MFGEGFKIAGGVPSPFSVHHLEAATQANADALSKCWNGERGM